MSLFSPSDIVTAAVQVKSLLLSGKVDDARQLADSIFDLPIATWADTESALAILREAGLSGNSQAILERYIELYPNDCNARIAFIESRLAIGWEEEDLEPLVLGFLSNDINEQLHLGKALSRLWKSRLSKLVYQKVISVDPENVDAWRGFSESLTRLKQFKAAKQSLRKLISLARPDAKCEFWAFVAELASLIKDRQMFAMAANKSENLYSEFEREQISTIMLARSYSNMSDDVALRNVFSNIRIEKITSDWVLSEYLRLAEQHNLLDFQVALARHASNINCNDNFKYKCETIVSENDRYAEKGLLWKNFKIDK